jgi:hypothetical protein
VTGRGGTTRAGRAVALVAFAALPVCPACAAASETSLADSAAGARPRALEDHWHAAFGVFVCDAYLPPVPAFDSPEGIHTHGDGVIHIHPFVESAAGDNARLGIFLQGAHIQVTANEVLVGAERYGAGDTCHGQPSDVEVVRWADVARDFEPEIVPKNGAELRFRADGEGYAIAVVPAGEGVPKPPAADSLAALGAADS